MMLFYSITLFFDFSLLLVNFNDIKIELVMYSDAQISTYMLTKRESAFCNQIHPNKMPRLAT